MQLPTTQRAGTRTVLGVIAGAALFLCLATTSEVPQIAREPIAAFLGRAASWLIWVALAPVVIVATRRIADQFEQIIARLLLHGVLAVPVMIVHSAALYAVQRGLHRTDLDIPLWNGGLAISQWRLTVNLITYLAIVGSVMALDAAALARERTYAAVKLSEQLAAAQLEALRLQLNPHFLFNALNTVAMLVRQGASESAVQTITGLGDILRHLLARPPRQVITVREELQLLDRYLDIEQIRLGARLRVVRDLEPLAFGAEIPSFVLQPIVENAIRHGIARRTSPGTLEIVARVADNALHLEVRDDGPGLDAQADRPMPGVGLANTVERLEQLYGGNFQFALESRAEGGTVATIVIPVSSRRRHVETAMTAGRA